MHPTETPPEIESFATWDLGDDVQAAIAGMGITKPTPIQALAIGPILEGRDVIAKAETGTGKTLAFGAPMMARVDPARASVLGLVLCPTRELSEQVYNVLVELGEPRDIRVALIVGGEEMAPQVHALKAGAQVVVGTPGRVLDLMNQGFLSFPWTEFAILDEADKMLEIGFIDDVKKILQATGEERQTLLFSATFPPPLLKLAREYTRDPAEVATASGIATVATILQLWLPVAEDDRARSLARMIEGSAEDDVFLVFCDRRSDVDKLMRRLERERFPVKALHGGYDQASRFRVMDAFRGGTVKALIATDVASRGLDVHLVTHVVNYNAPRDASDYTHRIGRTGRAGRRGTAVTLVGGGVDERRWRSLLRQVPWEIEELSRPGAVREADERGERGRDRDRGGRRRRRVGEEGEERPRSRDRGERGREGGGERGRGRARGPEREREGGERGRDRGPDPERPRDRDREPQGRRERDGGHPRGRRARSELAEEPRARSEEARRPVEERRPRESGGGGFGAGLEDGPPKAQGKRGRRPAPEPPAPEPPAPERAAPAEPMRPERRREGGTPFGSGL